MIAKTESFFGFDKRIVKKLILSFQNEFHVLVTVDICLLKLAKVIYICVTAIPLCVSSAVTTVNLFPCHYPINKN